MTKSESFVRSLVALTALATIALGAAGASAMSVDEIATYSKPDRQQILEAGAKKEGEMLWIGGLNEKTATRPILAAFKKKYPYIDAKAIRTGTAEGLQRVLAEHRAKTPRVDLINSNVIEELKEAGLAQRIKTPLLDSFPADFKDPEGLYATLRYSYHGIAAWNTSVVSEKDSPKTYGDLLDPRWKGKMVASDSMDTGLPFLMTYMRVLKGEKESMDYFEKLSKQQVKVSSASNRNLLDMVIAGEHTLILNPALHHIGQSKAKGAPVEGSMADPVLARNGYFVMLTTAPHPHATMLLIDFLLQEEAQNIIKQESFYPAHPDIEPLDEMKAYTPKAKGFKQLTMDDTILSKYGPESMGIFTKLFQ